MTGWTEIQKEYQRLFKSELSNKQLRFFYFGQIRASYKDSERAQKTIERQAHRKHVEREVAPWDVVVRLSFLYVYQQVKQKKLVFEHGFSYDKLNRVIYKILWGDYRRTHSVQLDGQKKNLPTFWAWAIDNKQKYDTVIAERGIKKMDLFISDTFVKIMKQRGMSD